MSIPATYIYVHSINLKKIIYAETYINTVTLVYNNNEWSISFLYWKLLLSPY